MMWSQLLNFNLPDYCNYKTAELKFYPLRVRKKQQCEKGLLLFRLNFASNKHS